MSYNNETGYHTVLDTLLRVYTRNCIGLESKHHNS